MPTFIDEATFVVVWFCLYLMLSGARSCSCLQMAWERVCVTSVEKG